MKSSPITVEVLRENFEIHEGLLYRKTGALCEGSPGSASYPQVTLVVDGRRLVARVHRVKFALIHGYFPPRVDHRNRDTQDNRPENLRAATPALNAANSTLPKRDLPRGVSRQRGRFRAYCTVNRRQVHLGTFTTVDEAKKAANQTRRELYGDFYVEA